jgi:hypothetical protein
MAKRVFFSFHYQDVIDFRAIVVRQHWMTKPDREEAGFFDASIWESARRTGSGSHVSDSDVRAQSLTRMLGRNVLKIEKLL